MLRVFYACNEIYCAKCLYAECRNAGKLLAPYNSTLVEVTESEKHSSLLHYVCKKFYSAGPRILSVSFVFRYTHTKN
jgi:hypothetical protein